MREQPRPGQLWKHWKGGLYVIVAIALIEADPSDELVIYHDIGDAAVAWARPMENFMANVFYDDRLTDNTTEWRFTRVPKPAHQEDARA